MASKTRLREAFELFDIDTRSGKLSANEVLQYMPQAVMPSPVQNLIPSVWFDIALRAQFEAVLTRPGPGSGAISTLDVEELLQAFDRNGEIDLESFIEACGVLDISGADHHHAGIEERGEEQGQSQKEDPEMDELLKQAVDFLQAKAALFSQREEPDATHLERQRQGKSSGTGCDS